MIITKKQYNEAIEKAVYKAIAEERAQFDKMMCDRDEARWRNERIENIERRMSSAFGDMTADLRSWKRAGTLATT